MLPGIVINGRFLTQRIFGVQRFASEVVKAIDLLIEGGEYTALEGRIEIVTPKGARDFPLRHIPVRQCGLGGGYFWEQCELPFHVGGGLLLNLCILGPVVLSRQVVVVHDATVPALPANFSRSFRTAYGVLVPLLCRRARCTVTVSEFSRREIGKWYGVDVSKMPVCFEGGDHVAAIPADHSIIDRLGLVGRKYFLGVGMGNNKNSDVVVAALHRAGLPDVLAVFTGSRDRKVNGALRRQHRGAQLIQSLLLRLVGIERRIHLLHGVQDGLAVIHQALTGGQVRYVDLRIEGAEVEQRPQRTRAEGPDVLADIRRRAPALLLAADRGDESDFWI